MYTGIFDSHAHYDDPRYDEDRDTLLPAIHAGGVALIMNIGADIATSRAAVGLAAQYPYIYATVGAHPHYAHQLPQDYLQTLEALAASPRVKAIGEIGLDYYYGSEHKEAQQQVFAQQLVLAKRLGLPVVVHNRDAHADTLGILQEHRPRAVVHCYSGSSQLAEQLVELGLYIGFTGVVTFKNARRALEAAAAVPLERLLIETDCPYLAPEPYRGQRCESRMLQQVLETLAPIKGVTPQQLADITRENAKKFYGIS